jgi:hypothetical protein
MITLPMPVLILPALFIVALLAVLYLQVQMIRNLNESNANSDKLIANYKELVTNLQETIKIRDDLLQLKDDLITNQKEIIRVDKVVNNCNNRLIAIAKERAEKFEYLYNLAKQSSEEPHQRYTNEYVSDWVDPWCTSITNTNASSLRWSMSWTWCMWSMSWPPWPGSRSSSRAGATPSWIPCG